MVDFFLSKTTMFCIKGSQIKTLILCCTYIHDFSVIFNTIQSTLHYQSNDWQNVDMYWYLKDKSSATCIF